MDQAELVSAATAQPSPSFNNSCLARGLPSMKSSGENRKSKTEEQNGGHQSNRTRRRLSQFFPNVRRRSSQQLLPPDTNNSSAASHNETWLPLPTPATSAVPSIDPTQPNTAVDQSDRSRISSFEHVPPSTETRQSHVGDYGLPARMPLEHPTPMAQNKLLPKVTSIVPSKVVTILDGQRCESTGLFAMNWLDVDDFERFKKQAIQTLQERGLVDPSDKSSILYQAHGYARILRRKDGRELRRCFLDEKQNWATHLNPMVASYLLEHGAMDIYIELQWDFVVLKLRQAGTTLKDAIRELLHENLICNFLGKKFIPRRVLLAIFDEQTVAELFAEDSSLSEPFFNGGHSPWRSKADFLTYVSLYGVSLLALFVYHDRLSFSCLHSVLKASKDEEFKPLQTRPLQEKDCPSDANKIDFDHLRNLQGIFRVYDFALDFDRIKRRPTHDCLDDTTVVPVICDTSDKLSKLGSGSFGDVFRVQIHPDHHNFDSDRSKSYALKRFKERFAEDGKHKHEESILRKLATVKHDNLVLYLAAWTQDGTFYMLFESAKENLREYMKRPAPPMNANTALDLLYQLFQMASAVEEIHRAAPAGLRPPIGDQLSPQPEQKRSTAFHYDLKPENILVFETAAELVFKVGDFGTARVHYVVSRSGDRYQSYVTESLHHGDPVYKAPDYVINNGKTSRPYDIWSLGCIFLELMLWAFHLRGGSDEDFRLERLLSPASGNQTDAFWYKHGPQIGLKPVVVGKIRALREHCAPYGVFGQVVQIIAEMLRMYPGNRPRAANVASDIEGLINQAQNDLQHDERSYDEPKLSGGRHYSAPPTEYNASGPKQDFVDSDPIWLAPAPASSHPPGLYQPLSHHGRARSFSGADIHPRIDTSPSTALLRNTGSQYLFPDSPDRREPMSRPRSRSQSSRPSLTLETPDGGRALLGDAGPFLHDASPEAMGHAKEILPEDL